MLVLQLLDRHSRVKLNPVIRPIQKNLLKPIIAVLTDSNKQQAKYSRVLRQISHHEGAALYPSRFDGT